MRSGKRKPSDVEYRAGWSTGLGRLLSFAAAGTVLVAGLVLPGGVVLTGPGSARAEPAAQEKQAFEAAKELGTVEAWDAFLASYPQGFHADLARAYLKKLATEPAAASPAAAPAAAAPAFDYPMVAGSWGGIVRRGPGQGNDKVASLKEGEEVTLMAPPVPVTPNDYPWFKISFRDGRTGYMWGGLLCSTGAERPDMFKLCTFTPYRESAGDAKPPAKREKSATSGGGGAPSWCASPDNAAERTICNSADLRRLDDVLNVAYGRAKFDSPKSHGEIDHEQRRWLGRRNACGTDAACIERRYGEQISFLESFFGN